MNFTKHLLLVILLIGFSSVAQEANTEERKPGHTNENKFKQLKDEKKKNDDNIVKSRKKLERLKGAIDLV